MSSMPVGAFSVLERWLDAPSSALEERARAYAEVAARTRPRPMSVAARYRFPRGRRTDGVPISAALRPWPPDAGGSAGHR